MNNDMEKRIAYLDYLRVIAIIAIIVLHISAQNWYTTDVNGFEWKTFNFVDSITRWGVPIFVMISGSLFLEKKITIKKIYSKYILRMLIAFFTWSLVYSIFLKDTSISERISIFLSGYYHMWFIPMIIGIYICLPIISAITQNSKTLKYYLIISIIFAFIIPQALTLISDFGGEEIIKYSSVLNKFVSDMKINIALGYVGYFILGYYINKIDLNKKQRIIIYILGIIGGIMTIVLDLIIALKTQKYCSNYYGNFNINVLFEAVAVFVLLKHIKVKPKKLIMKLSKYSFGVYLIHPLIIEQLDSLTGLNTLSFNPILSIICITLITVTISFTISGLLHCIPVVKKYMV